MLASKILVTLALLFPTALAGAQMPQDPPQRWTPERANAWYAAEPWLVGANYVPSDAINQLEMFQAETWNPALNDRELALAQSAGMNTVRVFLHDLLWQQDAAGFTRRLSDFLALAQHHGIRPILVLFDSCWNPKPHLGKQPAPRPGIHNSGWVQSPGVALADPTQEPRLQAYITGIVSAFANDPRVLAWDVWNEPDNGFGAYTPDEPPNKVDHVNALLPKVFAWARAAHPSQPLTSGVWAGNWTDPHYMSATTRIQLAQSDIITFHDYGWPEAFEARIHQLQPLGRPILCTEYMARGAGSTFDNDLPIAKRLHVAAINWGLVNGKTQTNLPWDSAERPYLRQQPPVWFHDVFHPDGTPYRQHELDQLRQLTGRP